MVIVLRAHGRRVVIFLNDHEPAHVHVLGGGGGGGEAKINLLGADGGPGLVWADGMTRSEIRRALRIVTQEQARLLARGEEIHGQAN